VTHCHRLFHIDVRPVKRACNVAKQILLGSVLFVRLVLLCAMQLVVEMNSLIRLRPLTLHVKDLTPWSTD
jgi:hypothetical protein